MCLCVKQYNRIIDCGLEIPLDRLVKELQLDKTSIMFNTTLSNRITVHDFFISKSIRKTYNNEWHHCKSSSYDTSR